MGFEALKLMVPGPIQPADDVLEAMSSPVQAHYGPAWTRFYNETLDLLREVYQTRGDVFLMVGSGTVAIDASMGSVLSTGEKIIIGVNGFFGERLQMVAQGYGLQVVRVEADWGQQLRAADFEAALGEHPDARAVFVVHLETSTSVINPVAEIGPICREHGVIFMVDAVSSLGGMHMKFDEWGIDLCASCTQKCLGAPPGLAPLAVSQRAWDAIERNPAKYHGWYADLRTWRFYTTAAEWKDWHPTPITMATNNVVSLRVGLEGLLAEGIPTRMERYRKLALHLRSGLRRIGFQPYTPDESMAPVLTAAYGPSGIPTGRIVNQMAERYHIKIAGGLGLLHDRIIRIGHMSPTTSEADLDEVLAALENVALSEGIQIK